VSYLHFFLDHPFRLLLLLLCDSITLARAILWIIMNFLFPRTGNGAGRFSHLKLDVEHIEEAMQNMLICLRDGGLF